MAPTTNQTPQVVLVMGFADYFKVLAAPEERNLKAVLSPGGPFVRAR